MAFNLLLFVSLCLGVSAVTFNDTVGTMPVWREEGVGQVPVISEGLGDSQVQTSIQGEYDYSNVYDLDNSSASEEYQDSGSYSVPVPHDSLKTFSGEFVSRKSFDSSGLDGNLSTVSGEPDLVVEEVPDQTPQHVGSLQDHLAPIEGGNIFTHATSEKQQIKSIGQDDEQDDKRRMDHAVVVGEGEFSTDLSVRWEKGSPSSERTAGIRDGGRHFQDDRGFFPLPFTEKPGTVTAPNSDPSHSVSGGDLVEGTSETRKIPILEASLPVEVLLLILVLSTLTLSCCLVLFGIVGRRVWKKFRDSPFMLERRIRRREARVRWRRKRNTGDSSAGQVDIEMQPLAAGDRGERPILRGLGPSVRDEMRALRDVQNGMEDRMLTMFEKTIVLLRNQQEDMHFLRVELQAVKRHAESQVNTYQEVLASVRNLSLSPVEGERLKRSRHHLRTSQHLEVPALSAYYTLSSVHRARRPCVTSSPIVVGAEAEGGAAYNNSRDTLFDKMFPEDLT